MIRIRPPRHAFATIFLSLWLAIWPMSGDGAIHVLITQFQAFLLLWPNLWAGAGCAVVGALLWRLAGSETTRIVGADLETAHQAPGFSRRRLCRGSRIGGLAVAARPAWPLPFAGPFPCPASPGNDSIRFGYGPRTIYAPLRPPGLDEGEARMIIDRLAPGLPAAMPDGRTSPRLRRPP